MTQTLEIRDMTVRYGDRVIIDRQTLAPFAAGRVVSLVGPNGAGKSTLLRAIAGLTPSTGVATFAGDDLNSMSISRRARQVAYMPQTLPQDVALTVLETVVAALEASPSPVFGVPAEDRAVAALQRVGAIDLAMRRLDTLSGGQRQIAGLAQALVREPRVLLLDEPTSALDLRHQLDVLNLARDYARAANAVVVLVLHDLQAAVRMSDHVVVLADGRVHAEGVPAQTITPRVLADVWEVNARVETCGRGQIQIMVDSAL